MAQPDKSETLKIANHLESRIGFFLVTPFLHYESLEYLLQVSKAVVISGYGRGSLPTSEKRFVHMISQALEKSIIVVISNQCQ